MKERLVADWLIKAGERGGLDVAFCQLLVSQGCRVHRAGHSPNELGKDVIAVTKSNELRAYQIKSGDIDLKEFEKIQPQLVNLVEASILHPNVRSGSRHRPFLVTGGKFSEPVETTVQGLNASWKRRGYEPLTLIGGSQLLPELMSLASDFWPLEPPEIKDFLTLYLAEGMGDLDTEAFARFLRQLLPENNLSKPVVARRIAAAGLFASYLLEAFNRQGDHWSSFCGWLITASHQAWAAEIHKLPPKSWRSAFDITKSAARTALENLAEETLSPGALRPKEPEFDDYTRLRNTIAASAVASRFLLHCYNEIHLEDGTAAIELIYKLVRDERLCFWGESALPSFLSVFWMLEHSKYHHVGENMLVQTLSLLAKRNHKLSDDPLAGPEISPDDVLLKLLKEIQNARPRQGRRAPVSWGIESLLHLLALRMRRQALKVRWHEITHVEMASFRPKRVIDTLTWHCNAGEEIERLPGKPQSWRELSARARKIDLSTLPNILQEDKEFALMFILAYPHRASIDLIKYLDASFC